MSNTRYWLALSLLVATVAGYYSLPHGRYTPPHRSLTTFPDQIGSYAGEDVFLSSEVLSTLGKGEFLQRVYREAAAELPIILYIGYYPRQETGDTVHSPQHCLPGAGWEPLDIGRMHIQLHDGRTVEVNRYVVQKGRERLLVLYWYQGRGRVAASEYWSKFYLVQDAILTNRTDGAVVRVSAPILGDEQETVHRLNDFVGQIFEVLGTFIPN